MFVHRREVCLILCEQVLAQISAAEASVRRTRRTRGVAALIGGGFTAVVSLVLSLAMLPVPIGVFAASLVGLGCVAWMVRWSHANRVCDVNLHEADETWLDVLWSDVCHLNSFRRELGQHGIRVPLLNIESSRILRREVTTLKKALTDSLYGRQPFR